MHLVELLLPLNDNSGKPFDLAKFDAIRQHLTERFGGLTFKRGLKDQLREGKSGAIFRSGVMAVVLHGGDVDPGDPIRVVLPPPPRLVLPPL